MKKVNNMTVFEPTDKCSLDEYSQKAATEVPELIKKAKEETNQKVIKISENDIKQDTEIATLKTNYTKLQEQNTKLESKIEKYKENMINLDAEGQSIHVEDSSDLEGKLEVLGNVEQETVKGIQLLERTNNGIDGWLFITNPAEKGIIEKVNYLGTKAAKFSVSESLSNWKYMMRTIDLSKLKNNTTYTIQFDCITNYDENNLSIYIQEGNGTNRFITFKPTAIKNKTQKRIKLVATSNSTPLKGQILFISPQDIGTVGRALTITNLILVEGDYSNKELEWEEYTNLESMPSTNYPSEIKAVGDNINLLENTAKTLTTNGITFTVNSDGTVIANGTATSLAQISLIANVKLPAGTYTIKDAKAYVESAEFNNWFDGLNNSSTLTFNTEVLLKNVYIQVKQGETVNNKIFYPKLEEGTIATSYSKFGQGSVEIKKQNKNLFDISKYPFTNKVAYSPIGELNYWTGYCGIVDYFPVEENTNYVFFNDLNKPIAYGLMFYNKNKEFISGIVENTTKFITPKNCEYIRFSIKSDIFPNKVQIEKGEVATEYVEHQEQTKILPIQKPMLEGDYFVKETDDWKEVHGWKKIILNGQENTWQLYVSGTRRFGLDLTKDLPKKETGKYATGYCTHFKVATTMTTDLTMFLQVEPGHFYIGIVDKNSKWVDVNALKSKLQELYNAGTPVILYYKVETPTKQPCTPEQTKVLEELHNFQTYKPVTNIATDSIAKLKLKYIADTKTYVDNKTSNLEQQVNTINKLLSTTKTSAKLLDNLQTDIEREVL